MIDKLKAYGFQALALVLLVAVVVLVFRLQGAQADLAQARQALAEERASRAAENTQRMQAALDDARATFRKREIHGQNQQAIADAHARRDRDHRAAVAAARADADRLRGQITDFATACGGGEAETLAAALQHCRDRSATLGRLLVEADSLAGELAGAAEQHAGEVRALKAVIANDRALMEPGDPGK